MPHDESRWAAANRIAFGAWLLVAGILLLIQMTGVLHVGGLGHLWPLLLIALGLARLATGRSAFWLLVIGIWFAFDEFTGYGAGETWPLLLVAAGLKIAWDALVGRPHRRPDREAPHV